jgi:regulator of PEP synthase PpsR (kinase-PPPase family)
MYRVYVISDGTGRTAAQILEAALTQFPDTEVEITMRPEIRTHGQVIDVITEAREADGFIVHTVVSRHLREHIIQSGRLHRVETIDLMGPLLAQLTDKFEGAPAEKPGLFYMLNKAYFQRIEAMEFAIRHDDGQRVDEIKKAEIVLVGVSRTFKTPLSMYLAFRGWYVANVPIVMGQPLPPIMDELPPERVFGLTTDRNHLAKIRQTRHEYLGGHTGDYADPSMIRLELMHAGKLLGEHPDWMKITVTNKPIEEIATEILHIIKREAEGGGD